MPDSILGPLPETMAGNVRVWSLRACKQVIIPEGVERIGSRWFWGSDVESVTISASVKEIGVGAFGKCKNLKEVVFTERSQLKTIKRSAFNCCDSLANINLPEGLEKIELGVFCETGLENVEFPASLRTIG